MEFRRTGSEDFPDQLKILITGPPKSGKTSLLGTVPNILVADTEPHANNLASIAHKNVPYVTIRSTQDLRDLHIHLSSDHQRAKVAESLSMPSIDAVAIDTLDTLQMLMKAERLKEKRQTQFLRDDWGWLKEEMTAIIRAFTNLPMHVLFTVHIKTQSLGDNNDGRTIVLPGLQGAISEEIAGMVGYSLYAFRTQEIAQDGQPYTRYWLRTEGDETYNFVGNRAAGRLPDIIDPSFQAIYDAAMGGREHIQAPAEVVEVSTPATGEGAAKDDSDDPVNAGALTHVKKVYDAVSQVFPEEKVRALTMGQARDLVRMWRACMADAAEGKIEDAVKEMTVYLEAHDLLDDGGLDITATIDTVLTWVGDNPARAQEAWEQETVRAKPRASLVAALLERGAKSSDISIEAAVALAEPVSTDPEPDPEPEPEPEPEIEVESVEAVTQSLGATVIDIQEGDDKPCEECNKPVDDVDIAVLSRSRFGRWLCVQHYINATKA